MDLVSMSSSLDSASDAIARTLLDLAKRLDAATEKVRKVEQKLQPSQICRLR